MFSQLLGKYLVDKKVLTDVQLREVLSEQAQTRVKLGTIAVAEKLLTEKQAEEINHLQTQMDKEENGYRTNLMELNPQTGQLKTLIGDGQVSSFCFENEDTVLFAAERKFQDKPEKYDHKTVYYRLSLNQGEAQ